MLIASRYAWIPQVVVLFVMAGVAGKHFNTSSMSAGGSAAVTASRLSRFSLCLSGPVGWAAAGSDFYVYVRPPSYLSTLNHELLRHPSTIKERLMPSVYQIG